MKANGGSFLLALMVAPLFFGWVIFMFGNWYRERTLDRYINRLEVDLQKNPIEGLAVFARVVGRSRFVRFHNLELSAQAINLREFSGTTTISLNEISKLVIRRFGLFVWMEIYHGEERIDLQTEYLVDIAVLISRSIGTPHDRKDFLTDQWISTTIVESTSANEV